jgi:hypothetical protein
MEAVVVETGPAAAVQTPNTSAVAWGAIIAGAVGAVSIGVVLMALGAGIGLTATSPWSYQGASATTIGLAAIVWMIIVQWLSAAFGGYVTGRLRLRWNYFDRDEVYFRDTVHGFLTWALALLITAILAWLVTLALMAARPQGQADNGAQADPIAYYANSLFRTEAPSGPIAGAMALVNGPAENHADAEARQILIHDLASDFPAEDRGWLARTVAQRTGLPAADAERRVDAVITNAKAAADKARKATATFSIAIALSLAVGAFIAAVAAALGGHQRDEDMIP